MYIDEVFTTCEALPHVLLASGMPGAGKTTLARLIAKELGTECVRLVPPFTAQTLYDAAMSMKDGQVLFIDEIHKLADHGPRAAENLLHMMEEGVLYLDGGVVKLADFTVVVATTNADKLPERHDATAHGIHPVDLPVWRSTYRKGYEYVAGEATLMTLLRENNNGLARLERFLIERGLIDHTPGGRRLTELGVFRIRHHMSEVAEEDTE